MRRLLVLLLMGCTVLGLPGVASAEGACPNEALRMELGSGGLSGCRAWERVTPVFKDGAIPFPVALAGDGSRMIITLSGVTGDDEGYALPNEGYYELVRTDGAWVIAAIDPASSLFPEQTYLDASEDLSRSLWTVRRASQSVQNQDLVVREADGSFAEVGPMVAPAQGPPAGEFQYFNFEGEVKYMGASSDLSHVFFRIIGAGPLWPGDTTFHIGEGTSLYEYVGRGNTRPLLVGREGEGQEGPLVSDCGTDLGSGIRRKHSADTYNAVSSDGETVFFTALGQNNFECEGVRAPLVDTVFARIGQGATAHTVAVSEPSQADCEACQTEPGVQERAEFQGASRDGSKAFFLTEQELFKEAKGMNLYEYDFANRPGHKVLRVSTGSTTPEVQGVARVSEDGSHVYFVARGVLTEGPNAEGGEPVPGGENLYVFERDAAHPGGRVAFIATLSEEDQQDWQQEDIRPVQATPDGRFLVFESVADLTNGDASAVTQLFEYDAAREVLVRVSVGEPGYTAGMQSAEENASIIGAQSYTMGLQADEATRSLAVSDDGSVVAFASAGGLTRAASAAGEAHRASMYEYRSAGAIADGRVYLASDGSSQFSALLLGTDESGGDVFFRTAAPVLASDRDTQVDIYDAREDGGFPLPAALSDCEREGLCQGAAAVAPPPPVAGGSASVSGGGNVMSAPSAPAGEAKPTAPRVRPLTRTQKLGAALRACRRKRGRSRAVCEARARKRFGASAKRKGRGR